MTIVFKNLISSKYAGTERTKQYSSPVGHTIIDTFTVTNISVSEVNFSCNLVSIGDIADNNNLVLKDRTIAPKETYTCPELVGQTLENGSSIFTLASVAGSLVIRASGREISN